MIKNVKFDLMFLILLLLTVVSFCWYMYRSYKNGYEDAVKDFYDGKLKMERIEKSVIEYKWKKDKGG